MTTYYSSSTRGFYTTDLHEHIPDDKIEIGADQHRQLLAEQAAGKVLSVENGKVLATESAGPTETELVSRCKVKAAALLARSDWAVLPDVQLRESSRKAILAYRKALRTLVLNPVVKPEWPEMPNVVWEI